MHVDGSCREIPSWNALPVVEGPTEETNMSLITEERNGAHPTPWSQGRIVCATKEKLSGFGGE